MSPTLWVWLFPLFGPPLSLPLFYFKVGCLPESKLWVHPSGGASATDQGKVSGLSPDGGGGNVVLANSSKPELPPSPLTAFVKVIGLPFSVCVCVCVCVCVFFSLASSALTG